MEDLTSLGKYGTLSIYNCNVLYLMIVCFFFLSVCLSCCFYLCCSFLIDFHSFFFFFFFFLLSSPSLFVFFLSFIPFCQYFSHVLFSSSLQSFFCLGNWNNTKVYVWGPCKTTPLNPQSLLHICFIFLEHFLYWLSSVQFNQSP